MEYSHNTATDSIDIYTSTDLVEKIKRAQAVVDEFDEAFEAHVTSLDEASQEAIDSLINAYWEKVEDNDSTNVSEYWRLHGQNLITPELIQGMADADIAQHEWDLLHAELDRRFGKELGQYVSDEACMLLSEVNPDKAHEEFNKPIQDWSTDVTYVLVCVRRLAENVPGGSYHQSSLDFDNLQEYREILTRSGVLDRSDQSKDVLHNPEELQRAQDLRTYYRSNDLYGRPLDEALRTPLLPSHDYAVHLNKEQRNALEHDLQSIDSDSRLEALEVTGLDTLPFMLTSDELKKALRVVPPLAFDGVEGIEIRTIAQEQHDTPHKTDLWHGKSVELGHHRHSLSENRARIVINNHPIKEAYRYSLEQVTRREITEEQEVIARQIALNVMMETVLHELGHAFHHKLPVVLLDVWHQATEVEDVAVSAYVKEKRVRHGSDATYAEDFADSFELFLKNSYHLREISPARYRAMEEIYDITTPPVPISDFWKSFIKDTDN